MVFTRNCTARALLHINLTWAAAEKAGAEGRPLSISIFTMSSAADTTTVGAAKLRCLFLPAQSGKTRKCEELIAEVKSSDDPSIDIWISANNKLLVYQTTKRLQDNLGSDEDEEGPITGTIFSWTSGTKLTNIPATDLATKVREGAELILVCAHRGRLVHVGTLLNQIAAFKDFDKSINLWIDEADQSVKLWMTLLDIFALPLIKTVTLVSATFHDVFTHFPRLPVIPYRCTLPSVYRGLRDCAHVEVEAESYAPSLVEATLKRFPHLMRPGMKAFLPAGLKRDYHEDMCERLQIRGFAVVLLNGTHKEIRMPRGLPTIPLKPYLTVKDPLDIPDEFNRTLAILYETHRLDRFPLAITGYLCVGRGVTFQGPGFVFDYGILSDIQNQATAYQTVARIFGNIGAFSKKPCVLYAASATIARIKEAEETATHLASLVHREKLETVCRDDFARAAAWEEEEKWVLHQTECASLEEARALMTRYGIVRRKPPMVAADGRYINPLLSREPMTYEALKSRLHSMLKTAYMGCNRPVKSRVMQNAFLFMGYKEDGSCAFIVRSVAKRGRKLVRKGVEPKKMRRLVRKAVEPKEVAKEAEEPKEEPKKMRRLIRK